MIAREEILEKLRGGERFDLLVVGGGATGCGVALDAASRGLTVALAERGDFGSGTSGKSTKLIHGGVRYLEQALLRFDRVQFNLVRDALHERAILLRIAPHLCHRLALVTPLYRSLDIPYYLAGLKLYDLLAGGLGLGASRFVSASEVLRRFPRLRRAGLKGGVLYWDGHFNDARMNVALALSAVKAGAAVANYLEVVGLVKKGGRVAGARVRERFTGSSWDIAARCVVNACGPCSDELRRLDDPEAAPLLQASSGIHLVLPPDLLPEATGLLIPRTEDGRVLFVLPWQDGSLVGTTDRPAAVCHDPEVDERDIAYLLRHLNRYLDTAVHASQIRSCWAGVRPLVRDPATSDTARLARDHVVNRSPSGLITITGGKWTTYRKMARDTVDFAVDAASLGGSRECRTDRIILHGGDEFREGGDLRLAEEHGLDADSARHLHDSYGDRAPEVAKLCRGRYAERLAFGHPFLKGEVLYAVREELAVTAGDFLARRIPLALLDKAAAEAAVPVVIGIMAEELGRDRETVREP